MAAEEFPTLVLVLLMSFEVDKLATFTVADEDVFALLALTVDVEALLITERPPTVRAVNPRWCFDTLSNWAMAVVAQSFTKVLVLVVEHGVAVVAVVAAYEETRHCCDEVKVILVVVDIDDFQWWSGIGGNAKNDRMAVGASDDFDLIVCIQNALKVLQVLKTVFPPNVKAMRNQFFANFFLQFADACGLV